MILIFCYCGSFFFVLFKETTKNASDDNLNFVKIKLFSLHANFTVQPISCNKKNGNDAAIVNRKRNKSFSIGGSISTR